MELKILVLREGFKKFVENAYYEKGMHAYKIWFVPK